MKHCAIKNNIPHDKLLQALALQERQAEERKAIGLPVGPVKSSPIKQTTANVKKRQLSSTDPDMELALALSISLSEAQNIGAVLEEHSTVSPIDFEERIIGDRSSFSRKSTLQSFGFYTNKPVTDHTTDNKSTRKRKIITPTILQNRTQEIRDQILAEKIAQILVGSEPLTQYALEKENSVPTKKVEIGTCRYSDDDALNPYYNSSARLWTSSQYSLKKSCYYVEKLHECMEFLDDEKNVDSSINAMEKDDQNHDKEKKNLDSELMRSGIDDCDSEIPDDSDHIGSLLTDWSEMIANHNMSDVGIFIKDNGFIHAHNLVLWARCHYLTNDYQICSYKNENCNHQCEPVRFKINWPQIDYNTAMIFLSYVYCAKVPEIDMNDENSYNQLQFLAEKYNLNKLLKHLYRMERVQKNNSRELNCQVDGKYANNNDDKTSQPEEQNYNGQDLSVKEISLNTSPDLFDDTEILDHHDLDSHDRDGTSSNDNCSSNTISDLPEGQSYKIQRKSGEHDISLFINKIRRRHARNILDSDTDCDSPLKGMKVYKQNPFGIDRNLNNSKVPNERSDNMLDNENALTMFERAISKDLNDKIDQQYKLIEVQHSFDVDCGSLEDSMYTKYMKNVNDNSIGMYRKALGFENIDFNQSIESKITPTSKNNSASSQHYENFSDSDYNDEIAPRSCHRHSPIAESSSGQHCSSPKDRSFKDMVHNDRELKNKLTPIIISSSDEENNDAVFNCLETSREEPNEYEEQPASLKGIEYSHEEFLTEEHLPIDQQSTSVHKISYDITPRKNYEKMTISDLHQQLHMYGLKPQRRRRAIQLLEHIYNELHPLVPVALFPSECDFSNNHHNEENPQLDKGTAIANERAPESPKKSSDIKKIFHQILTSDREFHIKILMYEPISLQLLYTILKNQGFQGKVADVIDFLDNECITFQDQEQKKTSGKKN
uniref:Structure-specific endonuclease subunit SLX4 n=1 Tax=Bracon brevicornis TaxID=1563983 RepID=A0A6V7KEY1_9HYME